MSELTNLTDRLAHLRDRKAPKNRKPFKPSAQTKKRSAPERRFATNYFSLFAYSLLGIALLAQIILIVWLDLV